MSYVSLTDLKSYLGLTISDDDDLLADLIVSVDAAIDMYTGTRFEVPSATEKKFTFGEDTGGYNAGYMDRRTLWLGEWLAQPPSIVTNGDGATISSTFFRALPTSGPHHTIVLNRYASVEWTFTEHPENCISVTGFWGFSITPPDNVVHAARRWSAYLYRQKDAQVFDQTAFTELGPMRIRAGMPTDVQELLDPYRWRTG